MGMVAATGLSRTRVARRASGFSLVELLVASFLLITVILGIVPLFMRSIMNNSAGNDQSHLSNYSKSQVEELTQLDFNHPRFEIPSGQTEVAVDEYWSREDKSWLAGEPPSGVAPWKRTTTVRQYNISAVDKDVANFDFTNSDAQDGGVAASGIHLREIVVAVESGSGPLGPRRRIVLRTLKAK